MTEELPPRDGIYLRLQAVLSDGTVLTVAIDPVVLMPITGRDVQEAWLTGFGPAVTALKLKLAALHLEPTYLPRVGVARIREITVEEQLRVLASHEKTASHE